MERTPIPGARLVRLDVTIAGHRGASLRAVFRTDGAEASVESRVTLASAQQHSLDQWRLREQLGRLGGTPFTLGSLDTGRLGEGLFVPVSELNRMRQEAVEQILLQRDWAEEARLQSRRQRVEAATSAGAMASAGAVRTAVTEGPFRLIAEVYQPDDARIAASSGATEIVLDPFLRHPVPPVRRVLALRDELLALGISLRLRTPTIIRPEDRAALDRWLALELPVQSGHVGLACELAGLGRDVVADYAANIFNPHTAAELFARGLARLSASVELTVEELGALVAPWSGSGFDVVVFGRPEGMTLEHCVLSAAFDRQPTTCRDLCVKSHPLVSLDDPAGYSFPVATDSDCRNRLLHSRPIEGSEFIPALWQSGIRGFRALFNLPGDPIDRIVAAYRAQLDNLNGSGGRPESTARSIVGRAFTRGHFTRPV